MITRYTLKLADGRLVTGAIQGSGGLVGGGDHNRERIERAIRLATLGCRTGIYEPQPGHALLYTNPTAADAGPCVDVDLRGAELIGSTKGAA